MRSVFRSRALSALLAFLLLLALCACGSEPELPAEATPSPVPTLETGGSWRGYFQAGDRLMRDLGVDLNPWLSGPLLGELELTVDGEGRCRLSVDYHACADDLRAAVTAFLLQLQAEERGEALSGLALAEDLGGDPNSLAGAVCSELMPPYSIRSGRLYSDKSGIIWEDGSVSELREENGGLRLRVDGLGETAMSPLAGGGS